jgi:hypothetical protein
MKRGTKTWLWGVGGGVVLAGLWPHVTPLLAATRPLLKALLKQLLLGAERLRTQAAQASEAIEDLIAEVRSELDAQLAHTGQGEVRAVPSASASGDGARAASAGDR